MSSEENQVRGVKGMNDVRPGAAEAFLDTAVWDRILSVAEQVLGQYAYRRVILPVVEETQLFARGIGGDTDIVAKEMYSFVDRGERSLTLRPEGTAGAVRAYVEANLPRTDPLQRWWYFGPMFRAERPQKGRYRQFYQIGAELFGAPTPAADAEMVGLVWDLCAALGLSGINVRLNSLGDPDSRVAYREVLRAYLGAHLEVLCESCRTRVERNPLRVLDCKREGCKAIIAKAPDIAESLTPASKAHFDEVLRLVEAQQIPFVRDSRLVRGLDYYTGTLFELTTTALGAQDAVLGGGRYDGLIEELGGGATPAIGFAAGVERIALLLAGDGTSRPTNGPDLYLAGFPGSESSMLSIARAARQAGLRAVEVDVAGGKLKGQVKRADKLGALALVVIGDNERQTGRGKLKHLGRGEEIEVDLTGAALAAAITRWK